MGPMAPMAPMTAAKAPYIPSVLETTPKSDLGELGWNPPGIDMDRYEIEILYLLYRYDNYW